MILQTNCKRLSVTIEWGCAAIRGLLSVGAKAAGSPVLSILEDPPLCLPALRADGCCGDCWYGGGYEPAVCEDRYRQSQQRAHTSSSIDMVVLLSTLLVSCVHEGGSEKRKGTCSRVIAYLLQLVQRALSDTTLLEIVLRRIHHLLDDLLVDIALFLDISYCHLAYPDRRRGRSQHTTSAFVMTAND